jgi:CDP-4-dehydro-6-deoxyglucose reductase
MPTVTIKPGGRTFQCEGKQTILEAALSASVSLNYGCSTGTCGLCIARLQQGEIEQVKHHDFALKEADKLSGDFLLCSYAAASHDVVVEAFEATGASDIPWQKIDAKIKKLNRVNEQIGIFTLQTPRTSRLRFLAGQNLRLQLPNDLSADLPIASCPCDDRNIEFHLRLDPGDEFYAGIFGSGSFPRPVHIEGPWGSDPGGTAKPVTLCFAYDTGFAPLRSWIEQQFTNDIPGKISLYWFADDDSGFYLVNLLHAWSDVFDAFAYHLSTPADEDQLSTVLKAAIDPLLSMPFDDSRVLIAGPRTFTDAVRTLLKTIDFPSSSLFVHSTAGP